MGNNRNEFLLNDVIPKFIKETDNKSIREAYDELSAENRKKDKAISTREYLARAEIIRRTFRVFRDNIHNLRGRIKSGKIKAGDIYDLFSEQILGDNKRQYNMSGLFDETLIAGNRNQYGVRRLVKCMSEEDNQTKPYIKYVSSTGEEISIKNVNVLLYKDANGTVRFLNKYLVQKSNSKKPLYEVYSIIDMLQMDTNEEYRKAVLDELLSDRNIQLSNSAGYIGKIKAEIAQKGTETTSQSGLEYSYQATDNYALEYNAEDLSAVVALKQGLDKFHQESERKDEIKEISLDELKAVYGITLKPKEPEQEKGEDR